VIALVGIGLAGCGNALITPQAALPPSNPDDFVVEAPITLIQLNTDTGNVTVTSEPGATTVSVRRVIDNESGRRIGVTTSVTGGALHLEGCEPRCSIDYTLVVPPGVTVGGATTEGAITLTSINNVDVSSENGAITLRNVTSGPVNLQSQNGPITLQHITSGPISLRTENGNIRGSGLAGSALKVQSLNGDMELAVTTPQDVSVRTNNGSVALTLPNQPYAVSVSTQNGPISVGVPNDQTARYHLDLSAANGDITVRPAP
jgi:hypothetical protein